MSFGFSVGDFVAAAQLAHKLGTALSDSKGSSPEYRQLAAQLNIVHKVLLQVEQMRASNQLEDTTIHAILFVVGCANEEMDGFLIRNGKYGESFKKGGSGNMVVDGVRKISWNSNMAGEVRKLKDSLLMMLLSINCLIALARYNSSKGTQALEFTTLTPGVTFVPSSEMKDIAVRDVTITKHVRSNDLLSDSGDPTFKRDNDPRSFFRPGQAFSVLLNCEFQFRIKGSDVITEETSNVWVLRRVAEMDHYSRIEWAEGSRDDSNFIGPTLIRRFLVIRDGFDSCICVGIHTYGGQGSVRQPDQSSHSILHCGKEPPRPLEGEVGMILPPIRMKAAHPSVALPPTARVQFGRVYRIDHDVQVKPLGLVHDESMAVLFSSFSKTCVQLSGPGPSGAAIPQNPASMDSGAKPKPSAVSSKLAAQVQNLVKEAAEGNRKVDKDLEYPEEYIDALKAAFTFQHHVPQEEPGRLAVPRWPI